MIHFDVVQGTSAWAELRIGIPTASCFDQIITPSTLKPSKSMDKYAYRLIAEQYLGTPLDEATSGAMQRGSVLERKAVQFYELRRDVDTTPIGFVMRDDKQAGCSPDRFVGNVGLLEIKTPMAHTHVGYLLDDKGIDYRLQVQGQLWVCEREWSDTLSYNPEMPPALVRQTRDEAIIKPLEIAVNIFIERVLELKQKLQKQYGMFPKLYVPDLKVSA